jgi:hypothetical protein
MRRSLLLAASLLVACGGNADATHTGTSGSTGGGGGGTGGATGSTTSSGPALAAAAGVTITQVAIYQGPKRPLFGGTEGAVTVPIVAGRDALVRVFAEAQAGYDGAPVTARLHLSTEAGPLEVSGVVGAADEATLGSTLNFAVPGSAIGTDTTYRVELLQPPAASGGDNPGARYPASGEAPLGAGSDGPTFHLVIVPVQYDADGSHRLPDTSPAKLQKYKEAFLATYPVRDVEITVHPVYPYAGTVWSFGLGWGALQSAMEQLRLDEGAKPEVYYYGAFSPTDSFSSYCLGTCTTGLGTIGTVESPETHAAIGLGYPDDDWVGTAIHEIGHAHGRTHAPCGGAKGTDPDYPYDAAGSGVWGYDLVHQALISPDVGKDMMGYCDPYWISDYTYAGLYERMREVNMVQVLPPVPRVWQRARVEMDGSMTPLPPAKMVEPKAATPVPVRIGGRVVEGRFLPYDHLPGGLLFW